MTHDQDEAVEVADEIIITNRGKIEQAGVPVEIYQNPKTPFVAKFIGESVEVKDFTENRRKAPCLRDESRKNFLQIESFSSTIKKNFCSER